MLKKMQFDRLERTFNVLSKISPYIAKEVLESKKLNNMSKKERGVLKIQSVYRGFKARKHFSELLFEYYKKLEDEEEKIRKQQVEEGLRALQAKEIEEKISDNEFIERQRKLRRISAAVTIQRRFRAYLKSPKRKFKPKKEEKIDKYAKYRQIINTPINLDDDDLSDDSDPEFESYISKVTGVNIKKTKMSAKEKVEQQEKNEMLEKANEMETLRKKYLSLLKAIDERSSELEKLLEEKVNLMTALHG